jgi:hypothetical protein
MGSSFVSLGDNGFWARDEMLEIWFHFLAKAISQNASAEMWLDVLHKEVVFLAGGGSGVGIVGITLDTYVQSPDQREHLVGFSQQAIALLTNFGETIPKEYLNSIPRHNEATWLEDWEPKYCICIGKHFIQLLHGELETTVSTSRTICIKPDA